MQTKEKYWILLSALTLIIALGISVYLTQHHFSLMYGMQDSKSFCSVNSKFDCDAVNVSPYSEIAGIPVALIATFAFLVELLFLLGIALLNEEEKSLPTRIFTLLTATNGIASLIMAVISVAFMKVFCLLCVSLYVTSALLIFFAWRILKVRNEKFNLNLLAKDLKSWVTVILLTSIPLGSIFVHKTMLDGVTEKMDDVVATAISTWKNNKSFNFHVEDEPSVGPANAPMKIIVFSDFQCPHCKRSAPSIHAFALAHKDKVQVTYQNFPLDSECNSQIKSNLHPESCFFTKAALCSYKQNKYVEAHDWIFKNQENLSHGLLPEMVKAIGVDENLLKKCMDNKETDDQMQSQISRAVMARVESTPSIFVNGRLLPNGYIIPILEKALKDTTPK